MAAGPRLRGVWRNEGFRWLRRSWFLQPGSPQPAIHSLSPEPRLETFFGLAWNKQSGSRLSPLKLMQQKPHERRTLNKFLTIVARSPCSWNSNQGEIHMRQVTVALAACLVASAFAAGQGSNGSKRT